MATMSTEEVLDVVRLKIGQAVDEIGGNAPFYPDDFILRNIKTANFELISLGIETAVVINPLAETITPDPELKIGMLLASGGASNIIKSDLLNRVKNGELGLSFSSGATSISTIQAAQQLKSVADDLGDWHSLLRSVFLSRDPNGILGRDQ